jgi:hypothetical protein
MERDALDGQDRRVAANGPRVWRCAGVHSRESERVTTGRLTIESLAKKFLTDYVYLKQPRAAARYKLAIRAHIIVG